MRSADEFHTNVRRIAVRLARHDRELRVGTRHVDGAVEALRRAGRARRPAWQRPEAQVGLGSLLFGLAWSAPDVVPLAFAEGDPQARAVTVATLIFLAAAGAGLAVHGWFRGQL